MKNYMKAFIALWTALLVCLGAYYIGFAPRDSEFTETENRTLAAFPEITAESLFSGRFSQEIETYLLDRFPGRDHVISAVNWLESTVSLASHDDYLLIAENVEDPLTAGDFQAELEALLAETVPVPETEAPMPPTEAAADAPEATVPAETEPAENPPIVPKPETAPDQLPEQLGVYMDTGEGEKAVDSYPRNNVVAVSRVVNKFAALLPENGKLMFTVGPPSQQVNRFVNAEEKIQYHSTWDEALNAITANNVYAFDTPDIFDDFIKRGEYVAFRTDNHWTPWGAYQVYCQMAAQAGKEPCSYEEDFAVTVEENFRGTYYRDSPSIYRSVEPDTLELLMPKIGVELRKITRPDTFEVIDFLNFNAPSNDRYAIYLSGPGGPWRYVESDNDQTENCLVVTDSFGLTVIPYLTYNYKQVHYYDARYFSQNAVGCTLTEMIEAYNIHDIYMIVADFHSFNSTFLMKTVNFHIDTK